MFRNKVGKKIGIIIKVGLDIFVDLRVEGGKVNLKIEEDIV